MAGGCYRVYDSVTVREPGGRYVISPGFWTLDGEVIGQTFPEGDEVNGRGSKTDSTDLPFPPNDFHYYDDEYTDADGNTTRLKGNAVWSLLAPAADTGFPFNLYAPPGGGIIETDYHWNINLFDPPIDVRLNELPLYSGPLSGFMPADLGLVFIGTRGPEGCAFDFEPSRLVLGTLDGQHGFLSAGVDSFFDVFHTIGNPLGLPMNPEGGVQCVGAFSQPPGGPESRISRHTPCLTGRRDVSFDTGIQFFNPGSEPFTGWVILGVSLPDQTHIPGAAIGLYRLNPADPASPLAVFIRASSFDGDELISIIETPLPPESQWLRIRLGVDFDLNRLLDININALSTGEEVSMTLDDHFLAGGVSPMGPTTHFGLVVAPDGSYAMGFDNIRIEPWPTARPLPADYNNDGGVDGPMSRPSSPTGSRACPRRMSTAMAASTAQMSSSSSPRGRTAAAAEPQRTNLFPSPGPGPCRPGLSCAQQPQRRGAREALRGHPVAVFHNRRPVLNMCPCSKRVNSGFGCRVPL